MCLNVSSTEEKFNLSFFTKNEKLENEIPLYRYVGSLVKNNSNFIPFSCSFTVTQLYDVTTRAAIAYEKSESAVITQPAA